MKKKRYIAGALVLVQMLLGLGMGNVWAKTAESEDEPKQLYAQSAVLMDADNGLSLIHI